MKYDYFDADYFQNGQTKGTVYNNYLEVARTSAIYREIAQLIFNVFRPVRTLEIGCATGIIVKHLNELGVDAHGIDVSEWAIANKEHDNVVLAGAEQLPYPDGYFDFVYSVHAMEHIPTALKESAFAELKRVSGSAIHFHMLPIVGEGPYSGPKEVVDEILHRDPTHSLLHFQLCCWPGHQRPSSSLERGSRQPDSVKLSSREERVASASGRSFWRTHLNRYWRME